MRTAGLITSTAAILLAAGLSACGGSDSPGFTAGGSPPSEPSEFHMFRPSSGMAEETEALLVEKGYVEPECVPGKSLEGTGEFNFKCTALEGPGEERTELAVVVDGSESGKPDLGPVMSYLPKP